MVALGAIRFSMVKTEPKKQIDFRYQEALSFEGDTGPYVQYAHARAHSILRKAGEWGAPDLSQATPYERALALDLLDFEEAVLEAAEERTPHVLAQYLLDLAASWNAYYNARENGQPATPVLTAPEGLRELRLSLVQSLQRTLATGLDLLVQATVLDSVRRLKAQGRFAMVLVSHDLGVVRAVSDRILVLLEGRVVEEGLADQVLEDPQHPYTQDLVQARL